jgi:hypothetical protein
MARSGLLVSVDMVYLAFPCTGAPVEKAKNKTTKIDFRISHFLFAKPLLSVAPEFKSYISEIKACQEKDKNKINMLPCRILCRSNEFITC